jgi:hypothetical protein
MYRRDLRTTLGKMTISACETYAALALGDPSLCKALIPLNGGLIGQDEVEMQTSEAGNGDGNGETQDERQ